MHQWEAMSFSRVQNDFVFQFALLLKPVGAPHVSRPQGGEGREEEAASIEFARGRCPVYGGPYAVYV